MKNLTIYRSSAGSGKTYTLVKAYLQIALQYPFQFRQILAITFTNKATAEMKSRIIKALGEIANGVESGLSKELEQTVKLVNCTLRERANEVLTNILHHYSDFSVSTIDSFFNEIVKSLAHELKLSLRFEIEIDQGLIIAKACEKLLNRVGTDDKLKRNLERFIEYKMEYEKGWKIKDELQNLAKHLFADTVREAHISHTESEFDEIINQLRKIRSSYEKKMGEYGKQFLNSIEKKGFTIDSFSHKKSGIAGYFQKIAVVQIPEEYKPKKRVLESFENPDKWISEASRKDNVLTGFIRLELQPLLTDLVNFHNENYLLYNSAHAALKLIYVSAILDKINQEIIHYRDENSIITLTDANRLIRSSVKSSDTPLVFEKTGNFYSHYLLDEFQDTSTIQWENIRPLINEVLSNNKSAMLVGDVKQSIYRWRGGNMELLHSGVEKDLTVFKDLISIQQLSINYRSVKQIVDFNNSFFVKAPYILENYNGKPLPLVKEAYSEALLQQQLPEIFKEDGLIKINFIDKVISEENGKEDNWRERSLSQMFDQINELISMKYAYKDIAILVRDNKDGNTIANYLYKKGIHQVLSNDSLLLSNASQVIFIINCLRLICDPGNRLLKKEIEWFLLDQSITGQDLHLFFSGSSINTTLSTTIVEFYTSIKVNASMPIDDVVTLIISHFALNKQPDAYVQRFQDIILEYLQKNLSDIGSFIRWWDDVIERKSFSVIMPDTSNAIQIITIHKAKGLQFPIVMIPISEWKIKPKPSEILWAPSVKVTPFDTLDEWPVQTSKQLEETVFKDRYLQTIEENYIDNLNLLYVAFTRAARQLYINVVRKNESKEKTNSDFIYDTLKSFPAFNSASDIFIIGELKPKIINKKEKLQNSLFSPVTNYLQEYPVHQWQNKLSLKIEQAFTSSEIEAGNMMHKALSFIQQEKELPKALHKIKYLYQLNKANIADLEKDLREIFNLCRANHWYDGTYYTVNESAFCTTDNKLMRPDRVMIRDTKAVILDYKTGAENASYLRQVKDYQQLLKDCGYTETECWLVYTTLKKLVPVH